MGLFRSRQKVEEVLEQEIDMGEQSERPELIMLIDERIEGIQEILEENMINISKIRCKAQKIESDISSYMGIIKSEIVIVETGKGNLRNYTNLKVLTNIWNIRDTMVHLTVMYSSDEVKDIFRRNKDVTLVKYTGLVSLITLLRNKGYKKPNRVVNDWLKVEKEDDTCYIPDGYKERPVSEIRDNEIDFLSEDADDSITCYKVKI